MPINRQTTGGLKISTLNKKKRNRRLRGGWSGVFKFSYVRIPRGSAFGTELGSQDACSERARAERITVAEEPGEHHDTLASFANFYLFRFLVLDECIFRGPVTRAMDADFQADNATAHILSLLDVEACKNRITYYKSYLNPRENFEF